MVQLRAQGRGEVTPVIMCQHTESLCHCWPSPGCATLPVRHGEVTVESLCASHVESISYQHTKPAERTDLNFTKGTLSRGILLILSPVRSQTPSFWLLSPLFGKCNLFYWLFWGQWVFLVINFRNKSAEASGIIFRKELLKEQPLSAKSNCRAHRGQAQPQDHRTFITARI